MDQTNIDEILDTAARLFAEHGYDGVGIREIARACNTPPPSIYYHFKSKLELYNEASAKKYEEAYERVEQAIERERDANKKIEALVGTLFDMFLEDRILFLLMQRDIIDAAVMRSRSVMKSHYEKNLAIIEKLLSAAVGKPVDRRATFAVASLILGYCELTTITDGVADAKGHAWYDEQRAYLCSLLKHSTLLSIAG
jgi:TetR/AcrR family transcriptional regulator